MNPPYCWLAADSVISPITSNATASVLGSLYQRLPISKPPSSTLLTSNKMCIRDSLETIARLTDHIITELKPTDE